MRRRMEEKARIERKVKEGTADSGTEGGRGEEEVEERKGEEKEKAETEVEVVRRAEKRGFKRTWKGSKGSPQCIEQKRKEQHWRKFRARYMAHWESSGLSFHI